MSSLRCLATLCLWIAQPAATPTTQPLPTNWPPLPDFKTRVDYIAWLHERLSADPAEDARPLYEELTTQEDDPPEVQAAKARMWGENGRGGIEGLFTGEDPTPERFAWQPADHPKWETAYQAQLAAGLPAKLMAIAQRPKLSALPYTCEAAEILEYMEQQRKERKLAPLDFGLKPDDQLLRMCLLPSLAVHRQAARVLLQNAWRAPGGTVDQAAMTAAIEACLMIADHVGESTLIAQLVNVAMRGYAYDTTLRALHEEVYHQAGASNLYQLLRRLDRASFVSMEPDADELAGMLDVLQFCYTPDADPMRVATQPQMERVRRLARFLQAQHRLHSEWQPAPLDIEVQIGDCDPRAGVQQAIDLLLEIRRVVESELPPQAEQRIQTLVEAFRADSRNHVVIREGIYPLYGRSFMLAGRAEARRRATQLVLALHRHQHRTGEWPANLRLIRGLPRELRTDPFSSRDFIYRIEDGKPILYSVSTNGRDDGGKHDRDWGQCPAQEGEDLPATDYVFWPVQVE